MTKTRTSSDTSQKDPRDRRIAELEAQLRERDELVATLQEQVRHLQEQLEGTKRAGKRQATPFARKKRAAQPKRSGRKRGKRRFSYRHKPAPEEVTETKREPLGCCPECEGELTERKEHEQFVVDIPPVEPVIIRYVTESGYCTRRRFTDPDNARFARRLRKHRDHLLRFLYVDGLDATNNQAERQLRPAVVTRKTTGCNRAAEGAATHSVLASVLATCHQRNVPILDFLAELQRVSGNPPSLGPPQPAPT